MGEAVSMAFKLPTKEDIMLSSGMYQLDMYKKHHERNGFSKMSRDLKQTP